MHDPGAAMFGGIAGHAGLFSNAYEIGVLMELLMNKGSINGKRFISTATTELFTSYQSNISRRGLGFDKAEKETTFYIDPSNFLVIKKTEKVKANGQENENSSFYSDHKKTNEGVVFPMSVSSGWGESEIIKLEINPKIDESVFKPSK